MTLRIIYDARERPAVRPADADGVLIYAGGNTTDPWRDDEIAAARERYRVPAWVYGPGRDAQADAAEFTRWLDEHGAPPGCSVMLDMETWVDRAYAEVFDEHLINLVHPYGSLSTLFANPRLDGWWPADWTGIPHLFAHPYVPATQYAAASQGQTGGPYDLSLADDRRVLLWDTAEPTHSIVTGGNGLSLAGLARQLHTEPSAMLRVTAHQDNLYPPDNAAYINAGDLHAPMREGLRWWYREGTS